MGAAIAPLVEGYGVIALGGEGRKNFAPGVGEFGEAMDAKDEFGGRGWVGGEGFEDMEDEAVGAGVDVPGGYARGEIEGREGFGVDGIRGRILVGIRHGEGRIASMPGLSIG